METMQDIPLISCRCQTDSGHGMMMKVMNQFGKPAGLGGKVVGTIMAHSAANKDRSAWAVSLLDVEPGDRVLEIGHGPGLALDLAFKAAPDVECFGVDHSSAMHAMASKRLRDHVVAGLCDLRVGTAEALPDFGTTFTKVVAINTIQFWETPRASLVKVASRMEEGGRIVVALQPRWKGATDDDADRAGAEIQTVMEKAGFHDVHRDVRAMKPVAAVCVVGTR